MPRPSVPYPDIQVVGTIAADEMPEEARPYSPRQGAMSELAHRIIDEHAQGRIVVIKLAHDKDATRLRSMAINYLHPQGMTIRLNVIGHGEARRAFLEVVPYNKRERGPGKNGVR